MKRIIAHFTFLLIPFICGAQTQLQINIAAIKSLEQVEANMETVLEQIKFEYASDSTFIKNLINSQKIWLTFRESELLVKYPNKLDESSVSACVSLYLQGLTQERIKSLSIWLSEIPEGDICIGSVKQKNKTNK